MESESRDTVRLHWHTVIIPQIKSNLNLGRGFLEQRELWGRKTIQQIMWTALTFGRLMVGNLPNREVDCLLTQRKRELSKWEGKYVHFSPFFTFFSSSSPAPKRVKMIPVWEFRPTALTNIRPDPSITWVPERKQKRYQWISPYQWNYIFLDSNFNIIAITTIIKADSNWIKSQLPSSTTTTTIPGGLVVRIRHSHRRGPGSIPSQGTHVWGSCGLMVRESDL